MFCGVFPILFLRFSASLHLSRLPLFISTYSPAHSQDSISQATLNLCISACLLVLSSSLASPLSLSPSITFPFWFVFHVFSSHSLHFHILLDFLQNFPSPCIPLPVILPSLLSLVTLPGSEIYMDSLLAPTIILRLCLNSFFPSFCIPSSLQFYSFSRSSVSPGSGTCISL